MKTRLLIFLSMLTMLLAVAANASAQTIAERAQARGNQIARANCFARSRASMLSTGVRRWNCIAWGTAGCYQPLRNVHYVECILHYWVKWALPFPTPYPYSNCSIFGEFVANNTRVRRVVNNDRWACHRHRYGPGNFA